VCGKERLEEAVSSPQKIAIYGRITRTQPWEDEQISQEKIVNGNVFSNRQYFGTLER